MKTENRSQYEALGNNYRVCGVYSPEPRVEVYCVKLNFNISKNWFILGYLCAFVALPRNKTLLFTLPCFKKRREALNFELHKNKTVMAGAPEC